MITTETKLSRRDELLMQLETSVDFLWHMRNKMANDPRTTHEQWTQISKGWQQAVMQRNAL